MYTHTIPEMSKKKLLLNRQSLEKMSKAKPERPSIAAESETQCTGNIGKAQSKKSAL
jgi:hypothetical protein